ncbi:MAG: hypothetical protein U0R19_33600 [Bryobacteraceae bacterium]
MDEELKQYMDERFAAVEAKIDNMETSVLRVFSKPGRLDEARRHAVAAALHAIDLEMGAMQEIGRKLEDCRSQ